MTWDNLHSHYQLQDWSKMPSIFAEQVADYFPKEGKIFEIGAGIGQDSRYFHSLGYDVRSTDIGTTAVDINCQNSEDQLKSGKYKVEVLDALTGLDIILDSTYDVVYAHLSLHYFTIGDTQAIIKNILRILKNGGLIVVLLNSVNDPEFGQGECIEDNYFCIAGQTTKRYYSIYSANQIFGNYFTTVLCDEAGETYKDREKGVHNLIRYIGKKL